MNERYMRVSRGWKCFATANPFLLALLFVQGCVSKGIVGITKVML